VFARGGRLLFLSLVDNEESFMRPKQSRFLLFGARHAIDSTALYIDFKLKTLMQTDEHVKWGEKDV
jgi:hypothetical protein